MMVKSKYNALNSTPRSYYRLWW